MDGDSRERKRTLSNSAINDCKTISGKWTNDEETYANKLIYDFQHGNLTDCSDGCTLRSYLSKKLNCAPMRVSKKFAGRCIGKLVYSSGGNGAKSDHNDYGQFTDLDTSNGNKSPRLLPKPVGVDSDKKTNHYHFTKSEGKIKSSRQISNSKQNFTSTDSFAVRIPSFEFDKRGLDMDEWMIHCESDFNINQSFDLSYGSKIGSRQGSRNRITRSNSSMFMLSSAV